MFGAKLGHLWFGVGLRVTVAAGSHPYMVATLETRTKGLGSLAVAAESRRISRGIYCIRAVQRVPLGTAAQSHGFNWLLFTEHDLKPRK